MATIKENFALAISKGLDAADLITDSKDKAMAYAAIASALARTGTITSGVAVAEPEKRENAQEMGSEDKAVMEEKAHHPKAAREDLKRKPAAKAKEEAPKKEEPKPAEPKKEEVKKEDKAPEAKAEEEWQPKSAEWDADAEEHLASELEFVQTKLEEYGEENVNECVKEYTQGHYKSYDQLNPMNIRAFCAYIRDCEAAPAESAS